MKPQTRIGFTTTIPVEIILAAGAVPVDLNNAFVTHPETERLMHRAESDGFPRSVCSWIKGIYGAVMEGNSADLLVMVTEGDCANTRAMMDAFRISNAPPLLTFDYPHDRDGERLLCQMRKLADALGTDLDEAERIRLELIPLRKKLERLDELTWKSGRVTGGENHIRLVSSSDFNGAPDRFSAELDVFLEEAGARQPRDYPIRLAYAGVPCVFSDLYEYLELKNAAVVLNEMQRQFSMPGEHAGLQEQYLNYTYPYDAFFRLEDLQRQIERRNVHGLIHYVQSFCHRGIEDIVLRKRLDVPILTLEGDRPGPLDERSRLRIDTFLEMLG